MFECPICRSPKYSKTDICSRCSTHAKQDHIYLRETPFDPRQLDNLPLEIMIKSPWNTSELPDGIPQFDTLLRNAHLTRKQRQALRLYFKGGLNFTAISKKLGISRYSVIDRFDLAIKKLKKYPTIFRLVRGSVRFPPKYSSTFFSDEVRSTDPIYHRKDISPEDRIKNIDPYLYYSKCFKCDHTDFKGIGKRGLCLNCGWYFTVHDADEFIAAQPWPRYPLTNERLKDL